VAGTAMHLSEHQERQGGPCRRGHCDFHPIPD
jgi:hypothetical protein